MGSKVYTKTGDKGLTSLIDGSRVRKNDQRIEAYGTIDELNSVVGVLATYIEEAQVLMTLEEIQNVLFNIGCNLALGDNLKKEVNESAVSEKLVKHIEDEIDRMQNAIPTLHKFIIPGGARSAAYAHIARTVCRRAERIIIGLDEQKPVEPILIQYVNRISDYFFVLSRYLNNLENIEEKTWKNPCE